MPPTSLLADGRRKWHHLDMRAPLAALPLLPRSDPGQNGPVEVQPSVTGGPYIWASAFSSFASLALSFCPNLLYLLPGRCSWLGLYPSGGVHAVNASSM